MYVTQSAMRFRIIGNPATSANRMNIRVIILLSMLMGFYPLPEEESASQKVEPIGLKMSRQGKKRSAEAGAKNLAAYHESTDNERTQALTHGAYSSTIRQKYSDKRTSEGQRLHQVITAIEDVLGGPPELTPFQQVRIGILRSRLIRFFQFSDWIDKKMDILDGEGNPVACLAELHRTEEGITRILKELEDSLKGGARKKTPSLSEIIEISGKDKKTA